MNGEFSNTQLYQLYQLIGEHLPLDKQELVEQLLKEIETQQGERERRYQEMAHTYRRTQEINQQYDQLFNAAPIGYVITDVVGQVFNVNETLLNWLDIDRKTFEQMGLGDFVETAEQAVYQQHLEELQTTQRAQRCEIILVPRSSGPMYVRLNSMFVAGVGLYQTAVTDLTHLRHSEEAYQTLAEHSAQGLVILQEGRPVYANQVMADMMGYPLEAYRQLSAEEFMQTVHSTYRAMVSAVQQQRPNDQAAPTHYEFLALRKDGQPVWLEMYVSEIVYEGERAVQAVVIDITERKQAEEQQQRNETLEQLVEARTAALTVTNQQLQEEITARRLTEKELRQREETFRALVENSADFITRLARDSTHLYANPALLQALGLTLEEVVGKTNSELGVPPETSQLFDTAREYVFENKEEFTLDFSYETTGGEQQFNTRITPEFDEEGAVKTVLTITRDITERKKAETQALELALEREKTNLIKSFLRDASHDLRTPLTGIIGTIYLLKRAELDEKQRKWVLGLENQAQRLKTILDEMFDMMRLELNIGFEFVPLAVNGFIEGVLAEFSKTAARQEKTLLFQAAAAPPMIQANERHLAQALTAILRNAFDYTPAGGEITIRTAVAEAQLVIEISDRGIGIPPTDMPHIFKRFFRGDKARGTQHGGSGLGLALANRVIELHGGTIDVESEVDVGTTFYIRLPAAE